MPATVSIITNPGTYSPVNKEIWLQVNSASSSSTNFKYLFRVNELDQLTSVVTDRGLYPIPPRPITGDGLFSPHRILNASVTYDFQPTLVGWTQSVNSIVKYNIRYGFEYNPQVDWVDTYFIGGGLGLTFGTTPHGCLVGDTLYLDKDNKVLNPQYDGTCSVIQVLDPYLLKTDKAFGSSTTLEGGTITNLTRFNGTSSTFYAYNGTRQYLERATQFYDYRISNTGRILNKYYGKYKKIYNNQYETISILVDNGSNSVGSAFVRTYDNSNIIVATYSFPYTVNNAYRRVDFGSGTLNLINAGVTFSNVKYYTVDFGTSSTTLYTNSTYLQAKYEIIGECSLFDNFRILWMNRHGAINYYNFSKYSKKTLNASQTTYNKILDWDYSIGDRGSTVLGQKVEEEYEIHTDWITEFDSEWLGELFSSSEIYHLDSNNNLLPIIKSGEPTYEFKSAVVDQIFSVSMKFRYAFPINIQNE